MGSNHPSWDPRVRLLSAEEVTSTLLHRLAVMAASGFRRSALMNYFANGRGQPGITDYMKLLIQVAIQYGWVTALFDNKDHPVALALWLKPGHTSVPWWVYLRLLPQIARVSTWTTPRLLWDLLALEFSHHAVMRDQPHLYLLTVVTHPDHRGHGLSSWLLHPAWRWCDEHNLPAYLESDDTGPSRPFQNSTLYQRMGFRVHRLVPLWNLTLRPRYPAMRRSPRT